MRPWPGRHMCRPDTARRLTAMSEDTLRRAVAEMVGAFTLTFIGAGAAAASGASPIRP